MFLLCKKLTVAYQVQVEEWPVWSWVKPHFPRLLQRSLLQVGPLELTF